MDKLNLRHSTEHVLHTAMSELYPDLVKVMGPAIEDGYYMDFDLETKITPEDFEKIETRMREIIESHLSFKKITTSYEEAKKTFSKNAYKMEFISEIEAGNKPITFYEMGEKGGKHYDLDLCSGPHVENTKEINPKAFKLLSVAGAYWRGDEKNKMLQRIYGTVFETEEELTKYLFQIEEAKRRDHKKLGQQLELFMFHETAPGMAYWLPKGVTLYNELVEFWRKEHYARGYQEICSPLINKKELYEISGHWDHYKDDMFIADMGENEVYCLKPMNCPNAMIVFGSKSRSYKELPLRLGDTDCLHRYERSGTLNGLLRIREFRQDDAHIFISEDQIKSEFQEVFKIVERFYSVFGLEYKFRLGTRPENFMGDVESWNKAEKELKEILAESKKEYFIEEGDGAFYGPKIDILMKDALGRDWQMGTIQLDFQMPKRFGLEYTNNQGEKKTPVVVHRVVYGSLERFIGLITEHFAGAFPVWMAPVQATIIPIGDRHHEYAQNIAAQFKAQNIRVEVDTRNEQMQAKIRDAQMLKVPYMLIIGDKEMQNGTLSVRLRHGDNVGAKPTQEVLDVISSKYLTKALDLW